VGITPVKTFFLQQQQQQQQQKQIRKQQQREFICYSFSCELSGVNEYWSEQIQRTESHRRGRQGCSVYGLTDYFWNVFPFVSQVFRCTCALHAQLRCFSFLPLLFVSHFSFVSSFVSRFSLLIHSDFVTIPLNGNVVQAVETIVEILSLRSGSISTSFTSAIIEFELASLIRWASTPSWGTKWWQRSEMAQKPLAQDEEK